MDQTEQEQRDWFARHFIGQLAVGVASDGSSAAALAPVRPQLFAPGTRRIRTGLLATMVDLVAGHAPGGAVGPTVDLRVQVLSPPPASGFLHLACTPLRVGRRNIVAETVLRSDTEPVPFARAVTTFVNTPVRSHIPFDAPLHSPPVPPMDEASFDEFVGARPRGAASMELDPGPRLTNGEQGTIQGGVQALLAELAAEHLLGGGQPMTAADLDIRYLDRLRNGPLVATAEAVPSSDGLPRARVVLTDAGNDDRIVAHVAVTLTPAS